MVQMSQLVTEVQQCLPLPKILMILAVRPNISQRSVLFLIVTIVHPIG